MSEDKRLELYEAMKETFGVGPATTVMEAIPPVGWADVATKRDLENFANQLRLEWTRDMAGLQRGLFFSMLAAMMTMTGILAGLIVAVN
jgi:hypothetical protein